MRTRPVFLLALLVAVAGLAAYLYVPAEIGRRDRAALDAARRLEAAVRPPAGAAVRDCNGPRDCWHVDREVDAVVAEMAATLRAVSGREPERRCDTHVDRTGLALRDCILRVETGRDHGVFVFVSTGVRRTDPLRKPVAKGTDVDVSSS